MQNSYFGWNTFPNFYYGSESLFRLILSIVVLIAGFFVAKRITHALRNGVHSLMKRDFIQNSPLGVLTESTEAFSGSGLLSNIVYWMVVFLFMSVAGEMLGILFFSSVIALFLSFVPALLSAGIVLFFGILSAGVVENLVKRQLKKMMPQQAVLMGTGSSYVVLTLFSLIALSELGVASEYILVLFTGLIFALSLAIGLALGLGAKNQVEDMLHTMVSEEKNRRSKTKGSK